MQRKWLNRNSIQTANNLVNNIKSFSSITKYLGSVKYSQVDYDIAKLIGQCRTYIAKASNSMNANGAEMVKNITIDEQGALAEYLVQGLMWSYPTITFEPLVSYRPDSDEADITIDLDGFKVDIKSILDFRNCLSINKDGHTHKKLLGNIHAYLGVRIFLNSQLADIYITGNDESQWRLLEKNGSAFYLVECNEKFDS